MSPPDKKLVLGLELVLNSNPAGGLSISVTPAPVRMSALLPSTMEIFPNVVQAPEPPGAAVLAEIADPPEAPVTVTVARSEKENVKPTKTNSSLNLALNIRLAKKTTRPPGGRRNYFRVRVGS